MKLNPPAWRVFAESMVWFLGAYITAGGTACGCDPRLQKAPECAPGESRACYGGDLFHAGKGVCRMGTQECVGEDGWTECVGWASPLDEVCNGWDDDCDGRIDNGVISNLPAEDQLCGSSEGECIQGQLRCKLGKVICYLERTPKNEVCNKKDDDCDGFTDEQVDIPVSVCYTGPPGTNFVGECMSGLLLCTDAGPRCVGEVLPDFQRSECRTMLDLNCDGEIDTSDDLKPQDMLILLDTSCSMVPRISASVTAIEAFLPVADAAPVTIRVGIALVDGVGGGCSLVADLGPPMDLAGRVAFTVGPPTGSGAEPTLPCLLASVAPVSGLNPTWTAERIVVLISDEACSSEWCLIGCQPGHWCENYDSIGDLLTPARVTGLVGNRAHLYSVVPKYQFPNYPPQRIEMPLNSQAELTGILDKLLPDALCLPSP